MTNPPIHETLVDEFNGEVTTNLETELSREIEKLQKRLQEPVRDQRGAPKGKPSGDIIRVALGQLKANTKLFQPRRLKDGEYHEDHVAELAQGLRARGDLDPIVVLKVRADAFLLVEGHHRVQAYRRETRESVPAQVWEGNVLGAVLHSRAVNSKAVRSLTAAERSEAAWQLVLTGLLKMREVVEATNVSLRTVKTMKATFKHLGTRSGTLGWAQARALAAGVVFDADDDLDDEALNERADEVFRRLSKAMGPLLARSPELLLRGLARNAPKTLERIVTAYRESREDDRED